MKRIFALLSIVISMVSLMQPAIAQSIPNNDFESWNIVSGVEKPIGGWDISDEAGLGCTPYSSIKTTDKATGNYAILLETNNCINFGGVHEGYAEINFPTTARPDSLKFKYKTTRGATDSAMVEVWVYNHSTPIGHIQYYIGNSQSTYKEVVIPFRYFSSLSTTAINIFMSSDEGWGGPAIGHRLWIDDLQFITVPTAIGNSYNNNLQHLLCSPLPASANLNVSFSLIVTADVKITLRDMTGAIILTSDSHCLAGNHTAPIDISRVPIGIYICEVQLQNGEKAIERIIKQ